MRYFQKEQVFLNIPAGGSQLIRVYNMKQAGQIVEYFIKAAAEDLSFKILINGIPLALNIEGERIPLFYDVSANDIIEVMAENGGVSPENAVVMILIQEF